MKEKKFNYFYKIENIINSKFYYGVHKTNNLDDGYMGSGVRIRRAIKKYKIENFKKEFLLFFDTFDEALDYETEFVNEELLMDPSCYNLHIGGRSWNDFNKSGDNLKTLRQGPSLRNKITGEIVNPFSIEEFNKLFNSGLYNGLTKNKVLVKDINGKNFMIDKNDSRYINGELIVVSFFKNKVLVKDKNNKKFWVDKEDSRYINGEVVSIHKGVKKSAEQKQKMKNTHKLNKHQQREKNSQYGTRWYWISNDILKLNKKIERKFIQEYEIQGWKRGRINYNNALIV